MTLKNARRRLFEIGWEVEPDSMPRYYKARPIGSTAWFKHFDLEYVIKYASTRNDRRAA